mmetsp:Transcript_86753/g.144771  ORF Transcript_86753/g.144771 Transcript_86753/m.144771 type:complete len:200 (+) Transcript_86753:1257-1856(+)
MATRQLYAGHCSGAAEARGGPEVPHALPGADRMCIYVCVLFSGSHQAHAQCLVVPSAGRSSGVGVSASCVFCALVAATPTCIAPIVWAKPLGVPLWSVGHPTVKNSRRPRRCHPHSPRAPAMGNPCAPPTGRSMAFPRLRPEPAKAAAPTQTGPPRQRGPHKARDRPLCPMHFYTGQRLLQKGQDVSPKLPRSLPSLTM